MDEAYTMRAVRYVELNPVRAGLAAAPWEWTWSSAKPHVTAGAADPVLDSEWADYFGGWNFGEWREAASPVKGLITLGTPSWGYPWMSADSSGFYLYTTDYTPPVFVPPVLCPQLTLDMAGSWNPVSNTANAPSTYLRTLTNNWSLASYAGYWFAAAGTNCKNPNRNSNSTIQPTGCPTATSFDKSSDGVVCADSAQYSSAWPLASPFSPVPPDNWKWNSDSYVHTKTNLGLGQGFILCRAPLGTTALYNLNTGDPLLSQIVQVINNGQ
jgi:hypothetical protein